MLVDLVFLVAGCGYEVAVRCLGAYNSINLHFLEATKSDPLGKGAGRCNEALIFWMRDPESTCSSLL